MQSKTLVGLSGSLSVDSVIGPQTVELDRLFLLASCKSSNLSHETLGSTPKIDTKTLLAVSQFLRTAARNCLHVGTNLQKR